jgi:hypothetical protein
MEVKITPVPGCMNIFLTVFTLGVYPLLGWLNQRNWPKSMDDQGLVTRGGSRIAWEKFTKVTRVVTKVARTGPGTEHFELQYSNGKVVLAPYRLQNGSQVLDFVMRHLPEQAKS